MAQIRHARADDARAMGVVMVSSFLDAHRGQMPEPLWQKRRDEWTPEASAESWRRTIAVEHPRYGLTIAGLVSIASCLLTAIRYIWA